MKALSPEENRYLDAALGWIELGNQTEADQELAKIGAENRTHLEVMQVTWRALDLAGKHAEALELAEAILEQAPERAFGWIHKTVSLRKLDRHEEALQNMLEAMKRFDRNPTMPFLAACCCAKQGQLASARQWLETTLECATNSRAREAIKQRILAEPDLKPLAKEIR